MKPAGKSIEIVAVGLGQAGGNLVAEMHRRGYRTLALNTASTDLSALGSGAMGLPEESRMYIGIEGYDGAGADLNYGRECLEESAEAIRERVSQLAEGADLVLLMAGLGGGTGSAVAQLVTALEPLELPLLAVATLPNDYESGIAKVNAVKAINQLVKEGLVGWAFVDNNRLAQAFGKVGMDEYYTEINKRICEPLDALNCLNDRAGVTPIRAFDGEDFRSVLMSNGILCFGDAEVTEITVDGLMQGVRDAVQLGQMMPEGIALESAAYAGVIIEAPEQVLHDTPFSTFEQFSEQLKDETGGAAVYMGVYRVDNATEARVRLLCSTQSMPEGIHEMVSSAKREGGRLREKLEQTVTGLDLGEIEEYELFRTSPGSTRSPARRGGRPARRSFPPPDAVPEYGGGGRGGGKGKSKAKQQAKPEPQAKAESEATAGGASPSIAPAGASIAPPAGATGAASETYDALIREYQQADDPAVQDRIAAQLDEDRQAGSTLTRYYAVRAMTKLDPGRFHDALEAAADDEDSTVRAVAKRALRA